MEELLKEIGDYILNIFAFDPNSPLLFTQFRFWAFLAVVFIGFAIVAGSFKKEKGVHLAGWRRLMRNGYLFLISILFYYKTSGLFVGLLILVTCSDFLIAQGIYHVRWSKKSQETDGRVERSYKALALLCLTVLIDLGILCYFKYSYFFADVINQMCGTNSGIYFSDSAFNYYDIRPVKTPLQKVHTCLLDAVCCMKSFL